MAPYMAKAYWWIFTETPLSTGAKLMFEGDTEVFQAT